MNFKLKINKDIKKLHPLIVFQKKNYLSGSILEINVGVDLSTAYNNKKKIIII